MSHSLYLTCRSSADGHVDIVARVVPDAEPWVGPYIIDLPSGPPPDGQAITSRPLSGVPASFADAIGRGYVAVMRCVASGDEPPQVRPQDARSMLAVIESGSRRDARAFARAKGYGGGSADLDLAIGAAVRAVGFVAVTRGAGGGSAHGH